MGDINIAYALFVAKDIVYVEVGKGKGWGAKQDGCSDFTKVILVQPDPDDRDENIKKLKKELEDKLGTLSL